MLGDVWEWTASDFTGYPGFEAFPYPEYSEVFFGPEHKVLRGGSWATRRDVIRTSFRNWDLPVRSQIFSGIRCARDESMETPLTEDQIAIDVHLPRDGVHAGMAEDVREGLSCPFKELPPKYFYDERGSELFERIMELPEYYPTRAERSILAARSGEIVAAAEAGILIELGSGSAAKTRCLLDAMQDVELLDTYVPVDISEEITRRTADELVQEYPGLRVHGIVCDYETHLERVSGANFCALSLARPI